MGSYSPPREILPPPLSGNVLRSVRNGLAGSEHSELTYSVWSRLSNKAARYSTTAPDERAIYCRRKTL